MLGGIEVGGIALRGVTGDGDCTVLGGIEMGGVVLHCARWG